MVLVDGPATQPLTVPVCSDEVSKLFQAAWTQSSESCIQCPQSDVTNALLPFLSMPKQMTQFATVSDKIVMLQGHWPMCNPSIWLHTAAAPERDRSFGCRHSFCVLEESERS